MPNLFLMSNDKGDELKCEEHQVPGFEAKGYTVVVPNIPAIPVVRPRLPNDLVGVTKDGDTIYCERHQVDRFTNLGYTEVDPYEQLEDHYERSGSEERIEGPDEGLRPDLGGEGRDVEPAPGPEDADEFPEELEGLTEDKTPAELVRESFIIQVREALAGLDQEDDKLWTKHGAPRVDAVSKAVGKDVSQDDIKEAWPDFVRGN